MVGIQERRPRIEPGTAMRDGQSDDSSSQARCSRPAGASNRALWSPCRDGDCARARARFGDSRPSRLALTTSAKSVMNDPISQTRKFETVRLDRENGSRHEIPPRHRAKSLSEMRSATHTHAEGTQTVAQTCWSESASNGCSSQDQRCIYRLFGERKTITEHVLDPALSEIHSGLREPRQ
jgi:hypothetical protein